MKNEDIDVAALVAAIRALAAESKNLKRALRRTWTEPMGETQKALVRCRRRTTELCVLRAWLRGRFHLQKPLREGAYPGMEWDRERWHRLTAERAARDFARRASA